MRYETPTEIVERKQERLRAGLWWAAPAIGIGALALGVGLLGAWLSSRPVQLLGFGLGVVSVGFMVGAFVRTAWVILAPAADAQVVSQTARGFGLNQADRARHLDDALAHVLPESRGWTRHQNPSTNALTPGPLDYWLEVAAPTRPAHQWLVVLLRPDGDIQVEYHVRKDRESSFEALFSVPHGEESQAITEIAEFVRDLITERRILTWDRNLLWGGRGFLTPDELERDRRRLKWATSWRGTYDWQR